MSKQTLLFVTCQRSILLSLEACYCSPFSIAFTSRSCTFQKVPNTQQTFHFQTQDSDFCLTNNHGSIKGSIVLRDITITTPCRDLVDTKTANLNTKDFQQGGCRLLNHSVFSEVDAPLSLSARRVLFTALSSSRFLIFLAAEMKAVRASEVDFYFYFF